MGLTAWAVDPDTAALNRPSSGFTAHFRPLYRSTSVVFAFGKFAVKCNYYRGVNIYSESSDCDNLKRTFSEMYIYAAGE